MKGLQEWEVVRLADTAVLVGLTRTEFISRMLREFSVCSQFCGRAWGWGNAWGEENQLLLQKNRITRQQTRMWAVNKVT